MDKRTLIGSLMAAVALSFGGHARAEVEEVKLASQYGIGYLPLTVMEWEEWGNPLEDPAIYAAMKGYSPYENIAAVPYPAILVTTSLNDTRVEVTEPAKWTARLRETATNPADRPILLKTEMVAGHGGVSGRYKAWRERAFQLAWLLDQVGVTA